MYICAISRSKRHIEENRYCDECVYVGEDLELVLGRDMATLWQTITDCSTSDESRARSLTAWVWVCCIVTQERETIIQRNLRFQLTKALVVRSHPEGKRAALKVRHVVSNELMLNYTTTDYIQLFDLFGDPHLNSLAAHSFSTLLQDTEEVLNIECRAIVRVSPCNNLL